MKDSLVSESDLRVLRFFFAIYKTDRARDRRLEVQVLCLAFMGDTDFVVGLVVDARLFNKAD